MREDFIYKQTVQWLDNKTNAAVTYCHVMLYLIWCNLIKAGDTAFHCTELLWRKLAGNMFALLFDEVNTLKVRAQTARLLRFLHPNRIKLVLKWQRGLFVDV